MSDCVRETRGKKTQTFNIPRTRCSLMLKKRKGFQDEKVNNLILGRSFLTIEGRERERVCKRYSVDKYNRTNAGICRKKLVRPAGAICRSTSELERGNCTRGCMMSLTSFRAPRFCGVPSVLTCFDMDCGTKSFNFWN